MGAHLLYDSITSFDFLLFNTFRPTVWTMSPVQFAVSVRVRPMTAGRRRPPQDTISSDILCTTKVQAAINHDMINAKLSRVYSSSILMYLTLCRATCHVSPLPQDSAGGRYKPPQVAAGHCKVMLLRRLVTVIDVLRHSCCQVDWQLTELNCTYSKNSNNITRNNVLRRSVASCGVLRSLDGPSWKVKLVTPYA